MKWIATLSVALFATSAMSVPIAAAEKRQDQLQIYKLRISAPSIPALHNRYISSSNNTLGVYERGGVEDAVKFYTTAGSGNGLFEFHTWPIGIIDHALGLVGNGGLRTFEDLTNPARFPNPSGASQSWREFTFGGVDPQSGEKINKVSYLDSTSRGWAAFPRAHGDWIVMWYDGQAIVTANYMPITLVYEEASQHEPVAPVVSSGAANGRY